MENLYNADKKLLRRIWGNIWGEKCWYLLRGIDLPDQKTNRSTISQSKVIAPDQRAPISVRSIVLQLLLKAASRLRNEKLYSTSISLFILTNDRHIVKTKQKILAADDSLTLTKVMLSLYDRLTEETKILTIKKIGIVLGGLHEKPKQLSFDDFIGKDTKNLLSLGIDNLNRRYGKTVVTIGHLPGRKIETNPIAFAYIPE